MVVCVCCGRKSSKLKEYWEDVWLCGCCSEDIAKTVCILSDKGWTFDKIKRD